MYQDSRWKHPKRGLRVRRLWFDGFLCQMCKAAGKITPLQAKPESYSTPAETVTTKPTEVQIAVTAAT